jgi:hypothetical protein
MEDEDDDGYKSVEIWMWDSIEKKWFSMREDVDFDELDGFLQEVFTENCNYPLTEISKWASMQMGSKKAGRAIVCNGSGWYEDEDDYGNCHDKQVKLVAIVNIDLPKRKFIEVRRMLQDLVKSGGYTPKKER